MIRSLRRVAMTGAHSIGPATLLAFLLAITPGVVAADFGGILPWTAWASGLWLAVIACLSLPGARHREAAISVAAYRLPGLLLLLAGLGMAQLMPLPGSLLRLVASGSADAYTGWLEPFSSADQTVLATVSIDRSLTRQAVSQLWQVAVCVLLAAYWFARRPHVFVILSALAVAGLAHASLGIFQRLTTPELTVWGIIGSAGGAPFGTFVNRSNAAVTLLLGLACSLGLLAWRLSAMSSSQHSRRAIRLRQVGDLIFDRLSLVAVVASLGLVLGLLVCGSRSGLAGVVGGLGLSLILMQRIHKSRGVLLVLSVLTVISLLAVSNLQLTRTTLDRTGDTIERTLETQQLDDGRFDHWPDGWRAATRQVMLGWGLETYRYAYLPFQQTSAAGWFVNADNLWLESLVESGLVGVAILAACLWLIVAGLRKLGYSFDPVDHGLAVAGWFALGALLASQFFDFGLKLHGNTLAAAVLFGAVVGRAAAIEVRRETAAVTPVKKRPLRTVGVASSPSPTVLTPLAASSGRQTVALMVALSAAVALSLWSAWGFRAAADRDAAIRQAFRAQTTASDQPQLLVDSWDRLERLVAGGDRDARLLIELSALRLAVARDQAGQSLPAGNDADEKRTVLRNVDSGTLGQLLLYQRDRQAAAVPAAIPRLHAWLGPEAVAGLEQIQNAAQTARQAAAEAVIHSPFSPEARIAWLSVLPPPEAGPTARQVIQQTAKLRQRNPAVLSLLARKSVVLGDTEMALRLWEQAIALQPRRAAGIIRLASEQPDFRASRLLPETTDAYYYAFTNRHSRALLDREALERGTQLLSENLPEPPVERAKRFQLVASIQDDLGLLAEAAETLQRGVALQPRDANLRVRYAEALLKARKYSPARDAAREGESIFPNDQRFRKLLDRIAKEIEQSTIRSDWPLD